MDNPPRNNDNVDNPPRNNDDVADDQVEISYMTTGNVTGVPRLQFFTFQDVDTAALWLFEVQQMKQELRRFNRGNPSLQDGHNWLQTFRQWHRRHGSNFVPHDIRRSVHEIETHLGLPLTVWWTFTSPVPLPSPRCLAD